MPFIHVQLVGKLTKEQKQEISKQFCETLQTVAQKEKADTYIVFDEVAAQNWAVGEKLLG